MLLSMRPQLVFKAPLFVTFTISDQKIVSGSTVPIGRIISAENALAWVSMDFI